MRILKTIEPQAHKTIETISLFAWEKCLNDLFEHVRIDVDGKKRKTDLLHYESIFDSFINLIGLPELSKTLIELKLKRAKQQMKYIASGNIFELNFIRITENEIEELEKATKSNTFKKQNIIQNLISLRKLGYGNSIDSKNITAFEFYSLVNHVNENNKN